MNDVEVSIMRSVGEMDLLRGKTSFNYMYDENVIDLLKKHFELKDSLYLIVKKDEDFVGFCSMDRDWWEDNFFFIREILVDSKFKKIGIGKLLFEKCIEHAKNKKAVGVVTETAFENYPMQNLCEKFGFTKWNNPRWKDGATYKLLF